MANIDSVKLPNGNEYNLQDIVTPRTAASQPNLFINGWFTVNQRGTSSGSVGTTATFIIDRWRGMRLGSYSISSSGLSLAWDGVHSTFGYLRQDIEGGELKGREVTFSAIVDGNIIEKSFTVPLSGEVTYSIDTNWELNVGTSNSPDAVIIALRTYTTTSHTIRAMKLEIGSTSTLHLDTAPDYTTELLKCQRYFIRYTHAAQWGAYGVVQNTSSTTGSLVLNLPVPMRATPTFNSSGSFQLYGATPVAVSSFSATFPDSSHAIVTITVGQSNLTPWVTTRLNNTTADAYIELDAEL